MVLFYNIIIGIARTVTMLFGWVNPKTRAFVTGRAGLLKKMASQISEPVIWIHCASLGEFEQGRPLIEAFKQQFPTKKILLTFFSPSGYEVRKGYPLADHIFYLPWDTRGNARALIRIAQPELAIFIKYEFWYHYAQELNSRGIPVLSVSSRFRKEQVFFKPAGVFFRRILKNFTHFFVQDNTTAELLASIGITNCTIAGDTRFDRVFKIASEQRDIPEVTRFKDEQKLMVIGSSWKADHDILIPFIHEHAYLKYIIAPHEIEEETLKDLESRLKLKTMRYSMLMKEPEDAQVLIIDNIGMLARLYQYGEYAYVGGAFGKGLHNILEAACYGIPVFFGNKNYKKFSEAVDLIQAGAAFAVGSKYSLKRAYEEVSRPENFIPACEAAKLYVQRNLGATEKVMEYCNSLINS